MLNGPRCIGYSSQKNSEKKFGQLFALANSGLPDFSWSKHSKTEKYTL
jgi:hypothetical protein